VRHERGTWKLERLTTGVMLLGAFAVPLGGVSIHTPGSVHPARAVVAVEDSAARSYSSAKPVIRSSTKHADAKVPTTLSERPVAAANVDADPPPVRFPPWWSGICDVNNIPWSFPLSSWDGLTACGPGPSRGGYDVAVEFFPGAWGEYDWECVELSMRWLYLEYGVRPYPANGSQVVADYSRADGGDLQKVPNDGMSVPRPGAVLSMGSMWGEGHTAVVTATNVTDGEGTINILEQNMNGGNGTNTLRVTDDVVEPDYGMPVTGWLQAPVAVGTGEPGSDSRVESGVDRDDDPGADPDVDPAPDLVRDGSFDYGSRGWHRVRRSWLVIVPSGRLETRPYDGNHFGVTNTSIPGGGIYQDVSLPIRAGERFCAGAVVVTASAHSGARGKMALWLLGKSENQSSLVGFGPLPGASQWTPVSTCLTANGPHSGLRIQFYDAEKTPTLGIDAVDVR